MISVVDSRLSGQRSMISGYTVCVSSLVKTLLKNLLKVSALSPYSLLPLPDEGGAEIYVCYMFNKITYLLNVHPVLVLYHIRFQMASESRK